MVDVTPLFLSFCSPAAPTSSTNTTAFIRNASELWLFLLSAASFVKSQASTFSNGRPHPSRALSQTSSSPTFRSPHLPSPRPSHAQLSPAINSHSPTLAGSDTAAFLTKHDEAFSKNPPLSADRRALSGHSTPNVHVVSAHCADQGTTSNLNYASRDARNETFSKEAGGVLKAVERCRAQVAALEATAENLQELLLQPHRKQTTSSGTKESGHTSSGGSWIGRLLPWRKSQTRPVGSNGGGATGTVDGICVASVLSCRRAIISALYELLKDVLASAQAQEFAELLRSQATLNLLDATAVASLGSPCAGSLSSSASVSTLFVDAPSSTVSASTIDPLSLKFREIVSGSHWPVPQMKEDASSLDPLYFLLPRCSPTLLGVATYAVKGGKKEAGMLKEHSTDSRVSARDVPKHSRVASTPSAQSSVPAPTTTGPWVSYQPSFAAETVLLQARLDTQQESLTEAQSRLMEISRLMGLFCGKLAEQTELCEAIGAVALEAVENVAGAQKHLRKAAERGSGYRLYVVAYFMVTALILLILDMITSKTWI
eukprot:GHVS01040097.1.p1 GENE.GHVS01040097.1~~GHVS01040097.1.p1  ORF type:complete len:543 (-),score=63.27 GHVS01040097.1:589-2217(-)